MEALAAVGLASNVIQFISFAQDLVSTSKQISRNADGALVENLELEAITKNLDRLGSSLLVRISHDASDTKEDKELRKLCQGCRYVSGLLIEKLNSLKVDLRFSGSVGRQWASFRQALNSVMNAEDIAELEGRLDRYQKGINSALLASLRYKPYVTWPGSIPANLQRRAQINKAEKNREIRNTRMSQQLFGFIDETKVWQADLIDTLHHNNWQPNSAHDIQLFTHQLGHGAQLDRELLHLQRVHHLLRFEEISERHATIAEAHKKTFDWIFHPGHLMTGADGSSEDAHAPSAISQQGSFMNWLLGDQSLYWITGKPGSGKSTLMKYLFNDERTLNAVARWGGEKELIIASFFFWNSGTVMQMSRIGLLQTLLYQCLKDRVKLIPSLFPTRWTNYTLFGGDVRPWTWLELTNALKTLVSMKQFNFLLFIDGLDEFDGPLLTIVSLVLELVKISPRTVKICVASRPWLVFEESFQQMPWLRMEDLTRPDIQLYIEENMQESLRWKQLQQFMPKEATKLITEIIDKAVGVFLWVILVVASLLSGLRDGDSINNLWDRLNKLPSTLEDLFQRILNHLNPEYFVEACEMFQMVLIAFEPPTLINFSFAQDGCMPAIHAPIGQLRKDELSYMAETMRRRIMSRCKGLLEVPQAHVDHERAKVGYLHRTVRDFFKSTEAWTYIRSGAPDFDAPLHLAASSLRLTKMTSVRVRAGVIDEFWHEALFCAEYARKCEDPTVAIPILDELSRVGDLYWGQTALHSNRYATWLAELVDTSTSRTIHEAWRGIMQIQIPLNGVPGPLQQVPHWVNTIYLADTTIVSFSYGIQQVASNILLSSFFDFAFFMRLNTYVLAKLTNPIVQQHHVEGWTLLSRSIDHKDYDIVQVLFSHGANPNSKCGSSDTAWTRLLTRARKCKDVQEQRDLCNMAVLYIDHGADLTAVCMDDFRTIFKNLEQEKREELVNKVEIVKEKQKLAAMQKQGHQRGSLHGVRNAIKAKCKTWSLFKN